eukprot:355617-Chlamydomonas_euryale.AAC.4
MDRAKDTSWHETSIVSLSTIITAEAFHPIKPSHCEFPRAMHHRNDPAASNPTSPCGPLELMTTQYMI